jgi:hypothetical protein
MVTPEALSEFKRIWMEEVGTEITDAEALTKATALLSLFDIIYRPIPKAWIKKYDDDQHAQPL